MRILLCEESGREKSLLERNQVSYVLVNLEEKLFAVIRSKIS